MKITAIHSYLVNPEKRTEEKSIIKGAVIDNSGLMFKMLEGIFKNAPVECNSDIAFQYEEDGSQNNDCRNMIIDYVKTGSIQAGSSIAARLQNITTKRSGLGLLFLILGKNRKTHRVVLSRFPADTGVLAEELKSGLSVQFVEKIFMKSAKAYKSAVYEGSSFDNDFWTGRAIDKQTTSDMSISEYWIRDFLASDFATTGERGTKRFATALKTVINGTKDLEIKEEITAALRLLKNLNGKSISPAIVVKKLHLSEGAEQAIKNEIKSTLYQEQFVMVTEELNKIIAFKSVELDNGAYLSAEATDFDKVFKTAGEKAGKITFSTQGKIINEKVRKSKA